MAAELGALFASTSRRRRLQANLVVALAVAATVIAVVPLVAVAFYLISQGAGVINIDFFTQDPPGDLSAVGGGIRNAISGSIEMTALATLVAAPAGILVAIFDTEIGGRPGAVARYVVDVLAALPSIVVGIFIYALVVVAQGHFSGFAGSMALAVIMLPVIVVSTEEMLRLIPIQVSEGARALGLRRWRTYWSVFIPTALSGIFTGLLLALSRALGEAAPLLFTALGNSFFSTDVTEPMQGLPLLIYRNALNSAFPAARDRAMGAALTLVAIVLIFNLTGRWLVSRRRPGRLAGR